MSNSVNALKKACCAAALGAGMLLATGSAHALASFNPVAAGLGGQVFETGTLVGGEVSRIDFGAPGADGLPTWQEHGFMIVTAAALPDTLQVPTGLGSDYTLFVSFDLAGVQPSDAPGYTLSASVSMYAAKGVSSFSFDSNGLAVATHQNTPILLGSMANTELVTYSFADAANGGLPTLAAQISGVLVTAANPILSGSFQVSGSFYHPYQGLSFDNGGATVLIQGGTDTLILTSVPEPAMPAMWLGAALLFGIRQRVRRQAGLDTPQRPAR